MAVKVTLVPAQIAPDGEAAILTLAGKFGFTVMVIAFDVAGEPVKHGLAVEVITTVTLSLLANEELVYVALLVPTGVAPTYHW